MGLTIMGLAAIIVTASLNVTVGWTLEGMCPAGADAFCDGLIWQTVVKYLPTWIFVVQILAVFALASPVALVRVGRR